MIRNIFPILAATVSITNAQPIAFSPAFETKLVDGTSLRRMYFHSGASRIYFRPSNLWEVTGAAASVVFRDKRFPDATIKLENAPAGMPGEFDASGLEEYRKVAASLLPVGASHVKPLGETPDATEINDWRGFETTLGYDVQGTKRIRSTLFIKLDAEREIRAIVDSQPESFKNLHEALVRSLATWYEEGR